MSVKLSQAGKIEFKSAIAEGMSMGQGLYGNPVTIGSIEPSWAQPSKEGDSAFLECVIDGDDCKIYAPYNFDLTRVKVDLTIVTALRDDAKYGVIKGKRKLSVA